MLEIKNGSFKTGSHSILKNFDLNISKNEINVILGANGAGKTTLLKILAGIYRLSSGTKTSSFRKNFYIPQEIEYPSEITLFEYLSSIFYSDAWKWTLSLQELEKINLVLKKINLYEKKDILMSKLSTGEKQFANLGLCLLSASDILFLDEPSSSLDMINTLMLYNILKELALGGITIVAVLHDINSAFKYAEKVILISNEGNILSGKPEEVISEQNLYNSYKIPVKLHKFQDELIIQPVI